jgi:hypothetical protein
MNFTRCYGIHWSCFMPLSDLGGLKTAFWMGLRGIWGGGLVTEDWSRVPSWCAIFVTRTLKSYLWGKQLPHAASYKQQPEITCKPDTIHACHM